MSKKISKIQKQAPLADQAYEIIKKAIINSEFPPGEYIVEASLAKSLGISRSPLREAMVKLQEEDYLESVPDRGTRVAPIRPKYFMDLYEYRCAVESLAARKSAKNITKWDINRMEKLVKKMDQYIRKNDFHSWSKNDYSFHDIIINKSDNEIVKREIKKLRDQLVRVALIANRFPEHIKESHKEHCMILEAMKLKSPEKLEKAVTSHIEKVIQRVSLALKKIDISKIPADGLSKYN
jgi:DNA-binding GntR family transcriptional regulator